MLENIIEERMWGYYEEMPMEDYEDEYMKYENFDDMKYNKMEEWEEIIKIWQINWN